jgi:hypothetical protein
MASDWVPLTVALNSLNRSMGLSDIYPFVLTGTALQKLRFVHEVIRAASEECREEKDSAPHDTATSAGKSRRSVTSASSSMTR